ncbi:protein kinase [Candidatus Uabimicrobium sp. HlEnr_7]|uniref:protein kinase domain-containing protein n=1 Tax=Candidatus Uabimicrobium helgolandensis TaxID=3095367 RepID=UPI0035591B5A
MEHTHLTQEDIIFLGALLQQSKSKNIITAYTNILIEARKKGVKDKAQKVLHNEELQITETSMSIFTIAGNSLLTEGVISIDNIPQQQQDYFRLNNDQKQAAVFGMAAMKEGMFNLQQVNQILSKWSKEYEKTQCNIAQFSVSNRFIENDMLQTIFQKANEIEEGLGRVQFRDGVLQVGASVPKNFGRYEIEEEIARGGMGIVYKAYDPSFQRTVALKVLIRGEGSSQLDVARFEREARSVYKIQHEHIIPVYDLGSEEGMPYFAMKFVEGHGLDHEKTPMPYRKAIKMLTPIANALYTAHQTDIIHRDIKPANIMIDKEGKTWLTDFGLAKDKQGIQELTQAGSFMGTPAYMAPEQIDHPESVDAKCDIYALGVVFYSLIVGKPPYEANTFPALLRKIAEGKAKPPHLARKEIPEDISRICMRAIAKKKKDRYASAQRFAKDLENAVASHKPGRKNLAVTGRNPDMRSKVRKKGKRRKQHSNANTGIIVAIISALAVLILIVVIASSSGDTKPENKNPDEFKYTNENDKENNNKTEEEVVKIPEKTPENDIKPKTKMSSHELANKLDQIRVFVKQKNYALADKYVKQILVDFPENARANYEKSYILVHQLKYQKALKYIDISLNSAASAISLSYKGHILKLLNRFEEAEQFYSGALKIRKCFHCYEQRAIIYAKLKKYDKAANDFFTVLSNNLQDELYFSRARTILEKMGDPYKLVTFFTKHIRKHPQSSYGYLERGLVYFSVIQNFDKAKDDLEKSIEINPRNIQARLSLGQVCLIKNELNKALKIAKELTKKAPKVYASYLLLGDCYIANKQKKKAVENWEKAIQKLQYASPKIRGQARADLERRIRNANN